MKSFLHKRGVLNAPFCTPGFLLPVAYSIKTLPTELALRSCKLAVSACRHVSTESKFLLLLKEHSYF